MVEAEAEAVNHRKDALHSKAPAQHLISQRYLAPVFVGVILPPFRPIVGFIGDDQMYPTYRMVIISRRSQPITTLRSFLDRASAVT